MKTPLTIITILQRWPDRRSLAEDTGVDLFAVHRWFQRGVVPAKYFKPLLDGARRRGIRIYAEEFVEALAVTTDQDGHACESVKCDAT